MNCIDRKELEQFLKGKLDPQRLLAVDDHIRSCSECKAAIAGLPARMRARADFSAALIGAKDCPEYEELSGYVDHTLEPKLAKAIEVHANMCELCARDIARIQELRSHAELRGKVAVRPGMMARRERTPFLGWKKALVALTAAGAVTAAVILGNFFGPASQPVTNVAKNPPAANHAPAPVKPNNPVVAINPELPRQNPAAPDKTQTTPKTAAQLNSKPKPAAPVVVAVLKDGNYRVIKQGNGLAFAKNGASTRTPIEARVAAAIDEKLRTGKIKPVKPVQMAMASIAMRDDNSGYEAPPTAPKQASPIAKVLINDTPTLVWSAVDLADSYRVRVYDDSGNLVAEETTDKTSITLAKPLARGQVYKWRVGVRFSESEEWAESAAAKFAIISAADYTSIQKLKNQLPGSHLALGAMYESLGLYDEAANEYRALRRANPNSKLAQKLLYDAAGVE